MYVPSRKQILHVFVGINKTRIPAAWRVGPKQLGRTLFLDGKEACEDSPIPDGPWPADIGSGSRRRAGRATGALRGDCPGRRVKAPGKREP